MTPTGMVFWFPVHFNVTAWIDTTVACIFMISNMSECVQTYLLDFLCPGTDHAMTVIYMATS